MKTFVKCLHCGTNMLEKLTKDYECPLCGKRCVFEGRIATVKGDLKK